MTTANRSRTQLLYLLAIVALASSNAAASAQGIAWRADYASARREAAEKARPLLLEFGTESCMWCRKLEASTLRDPAIVAVLNDRFVCLKVDGDRDTLLTGALNVSSYPTIVLAAADGKILATLDGYQDSPKLMEQLNRVAPATPAPEWMVHDFQEATRAIAISDYSRAIILLKGVTKDGGDRSIQVKSRTVLTDLESQAGTQLALAKQLNVRGRSQEAVDVLTDLLRSYAGTQASSESGVFLATLAAKPEVREGLRVRKARELLAQAKDEYRGEQFLSCMERCELLTTSYSDMAESTEAKQLVGAIQDNPEYLAKACKALNHRSGAMYLALAESWLKKGQPEQAVVCLERVLQTAPGSRQADAAQLRIAQLQKAGQTRSSAFRSVEKQ